MVKWLSFIKVSMKDGDLGIREKYMEDSLRIMDSYMKANSRIICLTGKENSTR